MKKGFLTLLVLMFSSVAVLAQVETQFGVRAGFNVTTIDQETDFGDATEPWRPGFNIGIASQFRTGEMFSIAPELLYTQRGYLVEYNTGGERNVRYDYVSLPLMFRLAFGDILKGYFNVGPTFGYLLGGNFRQEGDILGVNYEIEEDINFDENGTDPWDLDASRFEAGGAIGGGIQLDTEGGSFLIDLRYVHGFTNIADFANTDSYKNRVVSVSLIYLIPSVRDIEMGRAY